MSQATLEIRNLQVIYGGAIEAVRDVSFRVEPGRIVALLGANGAGKSTLLKAVSGVLAKEEGEIEGGAITFGGRDIAGLPAEMIVRLGIVQVPEGRRLFAPLTVDENLEMGGYAASPASWPSDGQWYSNCSRGLRSGGGRFPVICPGASSRWWRLGAP